MPNIIKVLETKKPFAKIEYRAWNFCSTTKEPELNPEINQDKSKYNTVNNTKEKKLDNESSDKCEGKELNENIDYKKSSPLARREQPVSSPLARREQPVSSPLAGALAKTSEIFTVLPVGKELDLLFFLCDICIKTCSLKTTEITTKTLNNYLGVNSNRLRNLVSRVVKKNLIKVISQNCSTAGAYRVFEFSKDIYDKLLLKLTSSKLSAQSTEALAGALADTTVCSSYNINTTTNVPENFKQIDYSPLADFGFDESHIIQIYREYTKNPELALSVEIIQNSIYALAYDLKHNDVAGSFKNAPVVVLTALLKKGQPYSSKTPHKVLSPREEAMREYLAAQEKQHQAIQELENKTKEFELLEWLKSLPEEELATFAPQDPCPQGMPEKVYQTSCRKKAQAAAKEYFLTMIWPQKLNQFDALKQNQKSEVDLTTK